MELFSMETLQRYRRKARRGGILISALAFVTVTSMLMIGMLTFSVSFYARAKTESDYESALALAEAGANYEFRKISSNAANADQKSGGTGVTYSLGNGTFNVYCSNKDGSTPWVPPANMYVTTVGTINGVSRTIQVSGKGYGATGSYAVYAVQSGSWSSKGHVVGDVGTNGSLNSSDPVDINGALKLNGGGAYTSGSFISTARTTSPNPVVWPYVHDIALAKFPSGGMSWLAIAGHNDNALCGSISHNQINAGGGTITFPSKAGGANYYLTTFIMSGSGTFNINNTLGPVTIWLGPDGGAGSFSGNPNFDFRSTVNITYVSSNPANRCIIYDGTTGPFTLESDGTMNVGIYAYNVNSLGQAIGSVDYRSPTTINGAILANTLIFEAEGWVNYSSGYFTTPGVGYYGFDDQWLEINGM